MPIDSTERITGGERKESNDDKSATAATTLSTEKPPRPVYHDRDDKKARTLRAITPRISGG